MGAAQTEWEGYKSAIADTWSGATLEQGPPAIDEKAVDELLARSDGLREQLSGHLTAGNVEERELAALQLQTAAAIDLDQAIRLAGAEEGAVEATLAADRWDEANAILATPTAEGISAVLGHRPDAGFGATAADRKKPLHEEVAATIDAIVADAGKASATTVKGLAGIPGDKLKLALGDSLDKVFSRLGEAANWLKRKAVALVRKAVEKLLAVFGTKADKIRERIGKWLDDLDEDAVKGLLKRLYGVDALKAAYAKQLEDGGSDMPPDQDARAREDLAKLAAKWHRQTTAIDFIGGLVPLAKKLILPITPIGPIAYSAIFLIATGYVIFMGGDYVDWRDEELLDLVDGVGYVVDDALGTTA